jgi:NAD(P)-dependent dehydrogenase (short-subunit alcohol dehydrogenase family)
LARAGVETRRQLLERGAQSVPTTIPRAALVTGGARRIGRAIALALGESGFDVAVHYGDSADDAAMTARDINDLGRRAVTLDADLADERAVATLIGRAQDRLGTLGVLVNNASRFGRDEWHDVTRASWDQHLETNLRAPFVLTQAFARALPPTAEGAVINLLDQRVWALTPHFVSYTVAKSALWTLTQTLALALAPRIRVNGIGPGPTLPSQYQTADQFARQAATTLLGRATSPEEIGRAVMAILSLPALTGQMLALDSGQHLEWGGGEDD